MPAKPKVPSPAAPGELALHANGASHAHDLGRERVSEIQRARIVAAMVEECSVRGAANVTVAHIVARAGVSRRTFYELFSDREACFVGAFDEGVARATRHVLGTYDPGAPWIDRVRTALAGLLSFLDMERDTGQLLLVGSLGAGAGALEHRRRVVGQMVALVDEGRAETKAGAELPPLTAEGIVGGVLSVLHSRVLVPSDGRPDSDLGSPVAERGLLDLTGPRARFELRVLRGHSLTLAQATTVTLSAWTSASNARPTADS